MNTNLIITSVLTLISVGFSIIALCFKKKALHSLKNLVKSYEESIALKEQQITSREEKYLWQEKLIKIYKDDVHNKEELIRYKDDIIIQQEKRVNGYKDRMDDYYNQLLTIKEEIVEENIADLSDFGHYLSKNEGTIENREGENKGTTERITNGTSGENVETT